MGYYVIKYSHMSRSLQARSARSYDRVARIIQSLAQPIRLAIVDALKDGEMCVCDITAAVGAERSNVSRHLSILSSAGIVASRKQGLMVFYKLRTPCILSVFNCVREVVQEDVRQSRQVLGCLK